MAIAPLNLTGFSQVNNAVDPSMWSSLGNLGEVYKKAQNQQKLSDLGKQLAAGSIDYKQAAGQLADMGDVNSTLKFLALSEQQRKENLALQASKDWTSDVTGAQPNAARTIAPPPAVPNAAADDETPPARAPVASSPTVVGDAEGVARGLYPAPSVPLPAPRPDDQGLSFSQRYDAAFPNRALPGPITAPAPIAAQPVAAAPPVAATPPAAAAEPAEFQLPPIPKLLGALSNPYLPEAQKKVAEDMLKRQFDALKPTEKIQTLQALHDRPDLLAIEKDLRKSQAPSVNMLPGEKEVDKTLGEMHSQFLKNALNAPNVKSTLDVAERAMTQPGFYSGSNSAAVLAAQRAAGALGIIDADKAAPNELFQKMSNKAVTDAAGGGGGGLGTGVSNADRDFIRDATFNLQNTPDGNRKVIATMRLLEDRKVEAAKEMNRYAHDHGGKVDIDVVDHMAKWADAHPLPLDKVFGIRITPVQGGGATGTHKDIPFTVQP
jgi:hypothetical protein